MVVTDTPRVERITALLHGEWEVMWKIHGGGSTERLEGKGPDDDS